MTSFLELVNYGRHNDCSDIHLSRELPPVFRKNGKLYQSDFEHNPQLIEQLIFSILTPAERKKLEDGSDLDFCHVTPQGLRQRVNIYKQQGSYAAAIRLLNDTIPSFEDLKLPPIIRKLASEPRGLILITGPTGSGKSTTLAAMIDKINMERSSHIMTIEDPIEYLHKHKKSIVNQREVGLDTHAFHNALKNAMREAPDVILIGEILDATTMEAAIAFAETGHLCLATLHSNNADQTIERILNFFPESAHKNVLMNLALNLRAVVSLRLVKGVDERRLPATEVLINTPMIRDLLRRGQVHEIKAAMEGSLEEGMHSFDQCLFKMVKQGRIEQEEALRAADSRDGLALKFRLSEGADGEHDPYADVTAMPITPTISHGYT